MRATSPPTALSIAAAALALVAAVVAPLAAPSTALAVRWLRPVPGEVARSFSYTRDAPFTAGAHRGADLAARPGTPVRAACAGRVVHAGRVAGPEQVVSVRCGRRRVSYLPLDTVAVRAGAPVRAGALIGSVARGHGGLHLGVRREGDPFGYEDPMALLQRPREPFAPAVPPPRSPAPLPRPAPRETAPRPAPGPTIARRSPRPVLDRRAPAPAGERPALAPAPDSPGVLDRRAPASQPAPRPVWAGLALLLLGAAGSGTAVVRRRQIRRRAAAIRFALGR